MSQCCEREHRWEQRMQPNTKLPSSLVKYANHTFNTSSANPRSIASNFNVSSLPQQLLSVAVLFYAIFPTFCRQEFHK